MSPHLCPVSASHADFAPTNNLFVMSTTIIPITSTCPRCNGQGRLPQFNHVQNGICFRCRGAKTVSNYRYTVKATPPPQDLS